MNNATREFIAVVLMGNANCVYVLLLLVAICVISSLITRIPKFVTVVTARIDGEAGLHMVFVYL